MFNRTFLRSHLSTTLPLFPVKPDYIDVLVWPTMLSKLLLQCYCLISFVFIDVISVSLVKSIAFPLVLLIWNIFPVWRQGPGSINHPDKATARSKSLLSEHSCLLIRWQKTTRYFLLNVLHIHSDFIYNVLHLLMAFFSRSIQEEANKAALILLAIVEHLKWNRKIKFFIPCYTSNSPVAELGKNYSTFCSQQ